MNKPIAPPCSDSHHRATAQPETYLRSRIDIAENLDDAAARPISSTADQVLSTRYANTMGIRRRHKEHGGFASNIDGIAVLDPHDDIQPAATLPTSDIK